MTKISKLCGCGTICLAEVGQSFKSGKLKWYSSFRCPSCGKATEIDGVDIPNEIREAILEQEGKWGLEINDDAKISLVLGILRKELNLSLIEMAKLRKLISGIVLIGTRTEMQRLEEILTMKSITTSIIRLENN